MADLSVKPIELKPILLVGRDKRREEGRKEKKKLLWGQEVAFFLSAAVNPCTGIWKQL